MNAKNSSELFHSLMGANSESEVSQILSGQSEGWSWQIYKETGFVSQVRPNPPSAIETLAGLVDFHFDSIVSQRLADLNIVIDTDKIDNSQLRQLLFADSTHWNSFKALQTAAENLKLYADGDRFKTNLVIESIGELLRPGNSLVNSFEAFRQIFQFCGKKGYILIAQKTSFETFQWTLIKKSTHSTVIEHLIFNGEIPVYKGAYADSSGLHSNETTIMHKLYQYQLPIGSRSVVAKDLMESLQEFLFDPICPFIVADQPSRYAFDRFPEKISLGQFFKLRMYSSKYLKDKFGFILNIPCGTIDVAIYLFKTKINGQHEQTSRHTIKRTFFKNGMHVIMLNKGMVHMHLDETFVTGTLGFQNLRNSLLIVLSCNSLEPQFKITILEERDNSAFERMMSALTKELKDNKVLKEENKKRDEN